MMINEIFYSLKPYIPRKIQLFLRRQITSYKRKKYAHCWPIDPKAGNPPQGWQGWPDGKRFALVLSHDVDTRKGHDNCEKLIEIEERFGFRSTFNFVPERYGEVSEKLIKKIQSKGFEVCVHGLHHDGKLFSSELIFRQRAERINFYLSQWNARGFTSPAMHHNLDWMHHLNITHSTSTFDTDPFEPQPDGVGTIFPFYVENSSKGFGFLELPYTLPQDSTLFVIMREKNIEIWKQKLDWIISKGGMALFNSHPDYMNFDGKKLGDEEYPAYFYEQFLTHIKNKYEEQFWNALPAEVNAFYMEKMVPNLEYLLS